MYLTIIRYLAVENMGVFIDSTPRLVLLGVDLPMWEISCDPITWVQKSSVGESDIVNWDLLYREVKHGICQLISLYITQDQSSDGNNTYNPISVR